MVYPQVCGKRRIVWRSAQSLPHLIPVLVTGILCVETVLIWERAGRPSESRSLETVCWLLSSARVKHPNLNS